MEPQRNTDDLPPKDPPSMSRKLAEAARSALGMRAIKTKPLWEDPNTICVIVRVLRHDDHALSLLGIHIYIYVQINIYIYIRMYMYITYIYMERKI